jgi:hypothetical protein
MQKTEDFPAAAVVAAEAAVVIGPDHAAPGEANQGVVRANNAMINAMNGGGGYVEMRECHTCHQVGHLARNCPKGSAPAAGTATAKKSGNFKKKKSGGDQKGKKPQTYTGSYGPVQKSRINANGESEPCDGQQYGEGN